MLRQSIAQIGFNSNSHQFLAIDEKIILSMIEK